jgi:hypothetical protein
VRYCEHGNKSCVSINTKSYRPAKRLSAVQDNLSLQLQPVASVPSESFSRPSPPTHPTIQDDYEYFTQTLPYEIKLLFSFVLFAFGPSQQVLARRTIGFKP